MPWGIRYTAIPFVNPAPIGTMPSKNDALPAGSVTVFGLVTFAPLFERNERANSFPSAGRSFAVKAVFVGTTPTDTSIGTGELRLSGQSNAWKR